MLTREFRVLLEGCHRRETRQRVLAGVIGDMVLHHTYPAAGRSDHDATATAPLQVRNGMFYGNQYTGHIDGHNLIEGIDGSKPQLPQG